MLPQVRGLPFVPRRRADVAEGRTQARSVRSTPRKLPRLRCSFCGQGWLCTFRHRTKLMLCMLCHTVQPCAQSCTSCKEQMAVYFCAVRAVSPPWLEIARMRGYWATRSRSHHSRYASFGTTIRRRRSTTARTAASAGSVGAHSVAFQRLAALEAPLCSPANV